jgi:hypothetical protein
MMSISLADKLWSSFHSALNSKWSVLTAAWSAITFEHIHEFLTLSGAWNFFIHHGGWWTIFGWGSIGALVGAGQRAAQKSLYVNSVEAGTAAAATTPIIVPKTATIIQGQSTSNSESAAIPPATP